MSLPLKKPSLWNMHVSDRLSPVCAFCLVSPRASAFERLIFLAEFTYERRTGERDTGKINKTERYGFMGRKIPRVHRSPESYLSPKKLGDNFFACVGCVARWSG